MKNETKIRLTVLAANQFRITVQDHMHTWEFFQSYQTMVARVHRGQVTLNPGWNYSRTTTKYLCRFLSEVTGHPASTSTIRRLVALGAYAVEKL